MCWVVSVGFFFIASWGTKLIVDSFNQKIHLENRGLRLIGGIIVLLIFWLACSMPTNTHTFFFRSLITDKVTSDIETTKGYLANIKNNIIVEEKIQDAQMKLQNSVDVKLAELQAEIMNDANPGFGPRSEEILRDFADILHVAKVDPLSFRGLSQQDRIRLCDEYRRKIYTLVETRKNIIRNEMTPTNDEYKKQAEKDYKNLELTKNYIEGKTLDVYNADDVQTICDRLNEGYSTIRKYSQFVNFKNANDERVYTAPNSVSKVKQLLSVFDVWKDFVNGEYEGQGFFFWVLMSILVDVAAFIFFDIAFKKSDY